MSMALSNTNGPMIEKYDRGKDSERRRMLTTSLTSLDTYRKSIPVPCARLFLKLMPQERRCRGLGEEHREYWRRTRNPRVHAMHIILRC